MNFSVGKPYRYMLLASVLLAAGIWTIRYSDAFSLNQCMIVPERYGGLLDDLDIPYGSHLVSLNGDEILDSLLKNEKIVQAEMHFRLPDGIEMRVNNINPIAAVLAGSENRLYLIDEYGYVLPTGHFSAEFDFPVITGLSSCRPHRRTENHRLGLIAEQLALLRRDNVEFYLALSSVDMGNEDYVTVRIEGLTFDAIMYAGDIADRIADLKKFLLNYSLDLSQTKQLDLRMKGLVVSS